MTEQPPELLDHRALPTRQVCGQTFEHGERAGAPSVVQRVGHVDPPSTSVECGHHPGRQQVADVRHGPVVGEVDELVVPQAVGTAPLDRSLLREHADQPAQDATALAFDAVGVAVDRWDQFPQLLEVVLLESIVDVNHCRPPSR